MDLLSSLNHRHHQPPSCLASPPDLDFEKNFVKKAKESPLTSAQKKRQAFAAPLLTTTPLSPSPSRHHSQTASHKSKCPRIRGNVSKASIFTDRSHMVRTRGFPLLLLVTTNRCNRHYRPPIRPSQQSQAPRSASRSHTLLDRLRQRHCWGRHLILAQESTVQAA